VKVRIHGKVCHHKGELHAKQCKANTREKWGLRLMTKELEKHIIII
jgi:hypothetical protein